LERTYRATDGRLDKLAEALIDAPEAWSPDQHKFKTPYEFLISSYRALGLAPPDMGQVGPVLTAMGQPPFNPGSPKGWAEEAQAWAAPDGIVKRMGWSEAFSATAMPPMAEPMEIARNALGARLG